MAAAKPAEINKRLGLDELASQYGYAAAFFNQNAELQSLIQQAVAGQWTPDKFRASFMNTQWYRSGTEASRQWSELSARDPAEATRRVHARALELMRQANEMGITLSSERLYKIAGDTLVWGYTDLQTKDVLAQEWVYVSGGGTQGQAASLETQVRQLADDYGINVSDAQMRDWVGGALQGRYTEDHLRDFVKDMSRSKYAGLGGYLDAGFTVKQVAAPYLTSYATILETNPEAVSLGDPLVQKALQGLPSKDTGLPAATSLYDFERQLKKDPRWLQTKNAHEEIKNAGIGVLRDMGIYG